MNPRSRNKNRANHTRGPQPFSIVPIQAPNFQFLNWITALCILLHLFFPLIFFIKLDQNVHLRTMKLPHNMEDHESLRPWNYIKDTSQGNSKQK